MFLESLNVVQATPANPSGTTSATAVMMGLGVSITPMSTGRLLVLASGAIFNAGIGQGATPQLSTGTGTAPVNGAAVTGTQIGGAIPYVSATIAGKAPFALQAMGSGFIKGTPVWIDIALSAQTAGTATLSNLSLTVMEC